MEASQRKVFYEFIKNLREASKKYPVVVEGKRDFFFLKRFGIRNIYTLSGKNYTDLAESIPPEVEKVILLTDVDKQGEKIFKKLSQVFKRYNIEVDGSFREYLKRLGVEEVEHLGELLFKG